MTTLYVHEQGVSVRRSGRRLLVCKSGQTLQTLRLRELERVALFGNVELSYSATATLLEAGIETVFLSPMGKFRGRLAPADGKNILLRRDQFRRLDDMEIRLHVGRSIIQAKIRNSRRVLQQHEYNHPAPELKQAVEDLDKRLAKVSRQESLDSLMGVEGDAARVYFAAFGKMVRSEFAFTVRSRRPPRDPVNALLSFGYTLVTTELTGACAAQGLDPQVGLLHDLDYGRPSMVLDLLEEFRQPVVDRLTLSLVNRRALRPEHFESRGEAGVLLNEEGRVRFFELYHRTLETPFRAPGADENVTYRELFQRQARRMRTVIETGADYSPYLLSGAAGPPSNPSDPSNDAIAEQKESDP